MSCKLQIFLSIWFTLLLLSIQCSYCYVHFFFSACLKPQPCTHTVKQIFQFQCISFIWLYSVNGPFAAPTTQFEYTVFINVCTLCWILPSCSAVSQCFQSLTTGYCTSNYQFKISSLSNQSATLLVIFKTSFKGALRKGVKHNNISTHPSIHPFTHPSIVYHRLCFAVLRGTGAYPSWHWARGDWHIIL